MGKTIFVLLDGCGNKLAKDNLGFLEHMSERKHAARYNVHGEIPGSSRPLYELLLTGVPVSDHGIVNNLIVRESKQESIFSLCRKNGLSTAAAAYHWISELYQSAPFSHLQDRFLFGSQGHIQNGIFYFEDTYPDSHVLCDADYLRTTYEPDFMMVHTMNIDEIGHKYGAGSKEHAFCALKMDTLLSTVLPLWLQSGYNIVITADHSMTAQGLHGGNMPELRDLPLYVFSDNIKKGVFEEQIVPQLLIAPLLCKLLDIEPSKQMCRIEDFEVRFFEED